jgi:hypothetical protein
VNALDVALLGVLEAGALERPARLLAEVTDRDRDEAPQAPRVVTDTYTICSSGPRIRSMMSLKMQGMEGIFAPGWSLGHRS